MWRTWSKRAFFLALLLLTISVAKAATTPAVPDETPPRLLGNQCRDDLRLALTHAITNAKESIHVAIYTMREPAVIRALNQAAQNGIAVMVVTDKKQSSKLAKQLDPNIQLVRRSTKGIMHQKIVVVDGIQVWAGSANFTTESLRSHGNLVATCLNADLAQELIRSIETRAQGQTPPPLQQHTWNVWDQEVELWQLPYDKPALGRLVELLDEAQESIRVAMFTWTHPTLANAVIAAHNRGVHVEAVIDYYSGKGVSRKVVEQLQAANIPVRLSLGPELLHHKMAWIDNNTLVMGSANWTRSAFTKNEDCFFILHELTPKQTKTLNKMWRITWIESNRCVSPNTEMERFSNLKP